MENRDSHLEEKQIQTVSAVESQQQKKRWFGRGIYGSKDVPIRLLDGFIIFVIAMIVVMVIFFAGNGGYEISFDTDGGSEIAKQSLRHGEYVEEPEVPVKPGYIFEGWVTSRDESMAELWDFAGDTVENSMILYAVWTPAQITVKFDLDGGNLNDREDIENKQVVYGECYGTLPIPQKEGYTFDGWIYSGNVITEDTIVTMTGEHVLTARWM